MILNKANILLPKKETDLSKWAVVACDQYTSQADYWERVEKLTENCFSSLKLTLPEIYLEDENVSERIEKIYKEMQAVPFDVYENSMILIERTLADGKTRKGVVLAVDLECYSYETNVKPLVRPTEKTIVERIPPRMAIRKNAFVELPHIMLLIDNPEMDIIEPLFEKNLEKIYDFKLMENGGSIKGFLLNDEKIINDLIEKVEMLASAELFNKKYSLSENLAPLAIAVGDGNHSMATAKAHWENIKLTLNDEEKKTHPARFVLAELGNIHDKGNEIEPIHRVLFNIDVNDVLTKAIEFYNENGCKAYISNSLVENTHCYPYFSSVEHKYLVVENPKWAIPMATLQSFLDYYEKVNPNLTVDYIHGEDIVCKLSENEKNIGFILPDIKKSEIFKGVILGGVLPKKTFSMGHAHDKRFYIEAKSIKG